MRLVRERRLRGEAEAVGQQLDAAGRGQRSLPLRDVLAPQELRVRRDVAELQQRRAVKLERSPFGA